MSKLNKLVSVGSKILEVLIDITMVLLTVIIIITLFADNEDLSSKLSRFNWTFNNQTFVLSSITNLKAFITAGMIGWIVLLFFISRIFRNVHLVFQITEGKNKLSTGSTPFQKENVKRINQVATYIFAIAIAKTVISGILSILSSHFILSIDFVTLFYGIIVLCLAQFFNYGVSLQEEVDGLL